MATGRRNPTGPLHSAARAAEPYIPARLPREYPFAREPARKNTRLAVKKKRKAESVSAERQMNRKRRLEQRISPARNPTSWLQKLRPIVAARTTVPKPRMAEGIRAPSSLTPKTSYPVLMSAIGRNGF